jgi:hypothetical protein
VIAIILSSDTALLTSVMICWNIIVAILNMSFRDELYIRSLNWLGTCCWLCLKGRGALISPTVVRHACVTEDSWGCVLLRSTAMKDSPGVVWLEENTVPVVVLGALCNFLFHISSSVCLQPW